MTTQPAPADRVDPNVRMPDSVRAAAAKAASFYEQPPADAPASAEPAKEPAAEGVTEPVTPAQPPAAAAPEPAKEPAAAPAAPVQPVEPQQPEPTEQDWHHRFLSMQGRYNASQKTIGSLQEQIAQMGDELMRMQGALQGQPPTQGQQPDTRYQKLTEKDVQEYGTELIDVVKRAAAEVVAPELESVKAENAELKREVAYTARERLLQHLDTALPEWRTINKDQRFLQWLNLPNVYTGVIRKQMLNQAYQAAHAPRVLAFFKDFLSEERATGHSTTPTQPAAPAAPRTAAVQLETLAAPGKARPASGNTDAPADKPVFTRAQIAAFYADVRAQRYAGRDAEKNRLEQEIFAAQREGRVR